MVDDRGTLSTVGERWMLRFERRLPHSTERVWRMITESDGLAKWFPARVEIERLSVGGRMTFTFSSEDLKRAEEAGVEGVPPVSDGEIRELEPGRVFAFDWTGELLRFELKAAAGGCLLVFTHVFDPDAAQAPRNAAGWHFCLEALGAALSGQAGPGEDRQSELQKAYAEALGS